MFTDSETKSTKHKIITIKTSVIFIKRIEIETSVSQL